MAETEREKLLDWVEKIGMEGIKSHHAAADDIKRDSANWLAFLLAGAGGALAFGAKLYVDNGRDFEAVTVASLAVSLCLFVLAAVLIRKCLWVKDIASIANEPMNLYQPRYRLDDLRAKELENLQERIEAVRKRNEKTARWLNRIRLAAVVTLPIGVTVWWLFS